MARMTKEELLEKLFHEDYEQLKGKRLRITRLRIPGKHRLLSTRTWDCTSVSMRGRIIPGNPSA